MGAAMRFLAPLFVLFAVLVSWAAPAYAAIEARIHVASQRMEVLVDGVRAGDYVVSTGKKGHRTPKGAFTPERMHKKYWSHKYHNAPMPHSVFFNGGIAVHGTTETARLGRPASHGCVRMAPQAAAEFFELVKQHGMSNSRIIVTD